MAIQPNTDTVSKINGQIKSYDLLNSNLFLPY